MKARFFMVSGTVDYFNNLIGVELVDGNYVLTFENETLTVDARQVRNFTVVTQ